MAFIITTTTYKAAAMRQRFYQNYKEYFPIELNLLLGYSFYVLISKSINWFLGLILHSSF